MIEKDSENKQQQIIFSDSDPVTKQYAEQFAEKNEQFTEQVLFNNQETFTVTLDNEEHSDLKNELNQDTSAQQSNLVKQGNRSWLWRSIIGLFVIIIAIEAIEFFITGFQQSPIITSIYAVLLACLTLVMGNTLWHELKGLSQFKHRQKIKSQATKLLLIDTEHLSESSNKAGIDFCNAISESLPCDLVFDNAKEQQAWQDAVAAHYNSKELVQLYSRVVLNRVDEKALNEIAKFSTEAVVLIALSPVALIDMLIIFSRNLRMINKIAGLYGLSLSYWSRIKLIKQVFVNMAYAGASELVADIGTDVLGAELLGKLSTRFAQGLGAGMLTARLGAKTMELCRPIPLEQKPNLTQVRKKIAQQIKCLVKPNKVD